MGNKAFKLSKKEEKQHDILIYYNTENSIALIIHQLYPMPIITNSYVNSEEYGYNLNNFYLIGSTEMNYEEFIKNCETIVTEIYKKEENKKKFCNCKLLLEVVSKLEYFGAGYNVAPARIYKGQMSFNSWK